MTAAFPPPSLGTAPAGLAPCDDAEVMRLWRECGLPEYFLGNGGTNHKLVAFAKACRAPAEPTEAQLQRVDAVLVAFGDDYHATNADMWRLKHRVRKALEGEG